MTSRRVGRGTGPAQQPVLLAVLLVVFCLAGLLAAAGRRASRWVREGAPDTFAANTARFDAVKEDLAGVSRVGFVSDRLAPWEDEFSLRYHLLPTVLFTDAERPFVVGLFEDRSRAAELARAHGLRIEVDYGGGVLLLVPDR